MAKLAGYVDYHRIIKSWKEGKSYWETAKLFDISKQRVQQIIKRWAKPADEQERKLNQLRLQDEAFERAGQFMASPVYQENGSSKIAL